MNSQGQTFAVIDGPVEFRMGSPLTEPDRFDREIQHQVLIPRRFAIAAKEVSVEQYREFEKENPGADHTYSHRYSPDLNGPMNGVSWYNAAAYCNWLSKKEGLPECYIPAENGKYTTGMSIPADVLKRKGYRLPTEAEWEYASRSGTMTSRYHGLSVDLLDGYARYQANSRDRAWSCGSLRPNDLGLFDMLGNMYEWVQDEYQPYKSGQDLIVSDDINILSHVYDNPRLLRSGAFNDQPAIIRSAYRLWIAPSYRSTNVGFRLSRSYP